MKFKTVVKCLGGVIGVTASLGVMAKLEEIGKAVARVDNNLLVFNGYDPATGKKAQPERYQVFDSTVSE